MYQQSNLLLFYLIHISLNIAIHFINNLKEH